MPRAPRLPTFSALLLAFLPATSPAAAGSLEDELGRSEVRVYSGAYPVPAGRTIGETALLERLERLGYRRVRGRRPERPGEYFWGHEVFWIHRRAHRLDGRSVPAELVGLELGPGGRIRGPRSPADAGAAGEPPREAPMPYLEPELLAESLAGDRAPRMPIAFDDLPEHVWRAVLAVEDARFFDHPGVDPRAVARALVANLRAGGVAQGGSTITQQLIKMRDLTPRRTLGRKASEAVRALALEAEHGKEEILSSYLDHVYYGHLDGVGIYGIGRAARSFFSKPARELDLAEAALLAGVIQSPNRLSPVRHPRAARRRRDRVLDRLEELGWAAPAAVAGARRRPLGLRPEAPARRPASHLLAWAAEVARDEAPRRLGRGRGVVVETTLDPQLQRAAEAAVADHLEVLRRRHRSLRRAPLGAALVALDGSTGAVLAHVGGDPRAEPGGFDRARRARRQPGSAIKPLVLLAAFDGCGREDALSPASRVADQPLRLDLPSGPWEPANADGRFRGVVDLRTALVRSLNVPFVRVARHCGLRSTARPLRRAGLSLPRRPPPSFVLGALEVTALELARAYTVFATPGDAVTPRAVHRIERPGGRGIETFGVHRRRVARPASAYLVRDLMRQAVEEGTARAARLEGTEAAAKTGTSSERRDAWLAGTAGGLVAVVWVGRDDGEPLGLAGSQAAAPLWRDFMATAVRTRAGAGPERPRGVVERFVDPETGLLVRGFNPRAQRRLFRRGALPRRNRFFRDDPPEPVIR